MATQLVPPNEEFLIFIVMVMIFIICTILDRCIVHRLSEITRDVNEDSKKTPIEYPDTKTLEFVYQTLNQRYQQECDLIKSLRTRAIFIMTSIGVILTLVGTLVLSVKNDADQLLILASNKTLTINNWQKDFFGIDFLIGTSCLILVLSWFWCLVRCMKMDQLQNTVKYPDDTDIKIHLSCGNVSDWDALSIKLIEKLNKNTKTLSIENNKFVDDFFWLDSVTYIVVVSAALCILQIILYGKIPAIYYPCLPIFGIIWGHFLISLLRYKDQFNLTWKEIRSLHIWKLIISPHPPNKGP